MPLALMLVGNMCKQIGLLLLKSFLARNFENWIGIFWDTDSRRSTSVVDDKERRRVDHDRSVATHDILKEIWDG
jgi:hypothetical protein